MFNIEIPASLWIEDKKQRSKRVNELVGISFILIRQVWILLKYSW
jgi:hypothetical protein